MKRSIVNDIIAIAAIALLITYFFYWVEARREVMLLCDKLPPGISKQGTQKQLERTELLTWDTHIAANGSSIVAYTPLDFGMMTCRVTFNKRGMIMYSAIE
ncbi:hypothetical protein N9V74_02855 [Alteromonas sp.]|jgi:hypothetical protein|nr:hypothetical protein [Alteromonas sp.]